MKKISIAFIAITLLFACSEKKSENNLHLIGNIKGLKKGTLYVQRVANNKLVALDTIAIDGNSNFETNIDLQSPEMLYLFLDRGVSNSLDNNLLFFAEPGDISIETNLENYIADAKVTGSKNQDLYYEYKKVDKRFQDESLTLIEKKFNAMKNKNESELTSIVAKQETNIKRKYLYATNFAINNKDYEVAPYIALSEIYDINLKYLDTIHKSMSPKVAQSLYGKKLTEYIASIKKQQ
ncbi:DUF4369 domain-containing protein [Flavobacterium sp.]|uniref:DUF4369 domain-containing protein n=1 Tax=Flavobacterium sp. TaxID=239 RepID=UPI0008D5D21E|nr:DUF4369 domain-containing protein [Flavobacterium sp.]OGS65768.1 MAG: hypothetical protein A2X21_02195 [Flavobacteria bacterium GWA2_35_26]HCF03014.1 hypothetical protein [Flavobacterium sp.]